MKKSNSDDQVSSSREERRKLVKAIGSAATLETSLNIPGGYLERMKDDGVIVFSNDCSSRHVRQFNQFAVTWSVFG